MHLPHRLHGLTPVRRLLLALALAMALAAPDLLAPTEVAAQPLPAPAPVRYDADYPDPAFHAGRRQALLDAMPDTAFILIPSAPERTRDNDVLYEYRQSSDLYYLTGSHEPGTLLLLATHGIDLGGRETREVLFVPQNTGFSETWLGRRFGPGGAERVLGVEVALPLSEFENVMRTAAETGAALYVLPPAEGVTPGTELATQTEILSGLLEDQPDAPMRSYRLRETLDRLRSVKQDEELRLMQRAVDLTTEAHRAALRAAEPGMYEYELEAVIEYVFHRGGAEAPAFPSIVGSGENSVILHYESNRRQMEAGDLVVMDIGAEYHGYAADVTRTIPVDGTFSDEQKAIYQLVLDAQEAGIQATRAGNGFGAPHEAARLVLAAGLRELGILDEDGDVMDYLLHGTSHYLGLSVHDVGPRNGLLVPGNVITVEPGLYFKPSPDLDPRWWNIGIRIEDDVLVTDGDPKVLSAAAPKTVEEIERVMREECWAVGARCD